MGCSRLGLLGCCETPRCFKLTDVEKEYYGPSRELKDKREKVNGQDGDPAIDGLRVVRWGAGCDAAVAFIDCPSVTFGSR